MKTMRQKQVYSIIRNIVALTFIISGCSGKLKLRMHYRRTGSQKNKMVAQWKIIGIPGLTDLWLFTLESIPLEPGIQLSDSKIPLKSGIRGLTGARIFSVIQNPRRWLRNARLICMKMHYLMLSQTILQDFSRILQIKFAFYVTGLINAFFNCSYYTFHENSIEGRSWEASRFLCKNSSEGDLVSIEEEEERNFVKNIIKNITAIKYFIGLEKNNGKWKWLSNKTIVDSSKGKSPWAPGQPCGTSPKEKVNCTTIYGKYRSYFGRFDDIHCRRLMKDAGHICERVVSCTKHELQRGRSLFVEESVLADPEHALAVFSFSYWVSRKRKTKSPPLPLLLHKRKLPQTKCFKVMVIEIVEGIRGYINLS